MNQKIEAIMRHFSELTKTEIDMMIERCEMAAVEYADEIHMAGGLSTGSYDVYKAIEDAIFREYAIAKGKVSEIPNRANPGRQRHTSLVRAI